MVWGQVGIVPVRITAVGMRCLVNSVQKVKHISISSPYF